MKWDEVRKRMQDVARLRHLARSTEHSYISWAKKYGFWLKEHNPSGEPSAKAESFLTWMAHQEYSAISQNQAFSAILFMYRDCLGIELKNVHALRAKTPQRERYAPTVAETQALLNDVKDSAGYPVRLVVHLLYGCGMRVSEPLNLRIKDICLAERKIIIRQAKGAKDRVVSLPKNLAEPLEAQMGRALSVADRDIRNALPVKLPDRLDVKYPKLAFCRTWGFVFPLRNPCRDERTGQMVRFRMLEQTVQRGVRESVRRLGLNPMTSPHSLRHAWATHMMRSGASVRDVQELMGHRSLETTMGYLHPEVERTTSPIESMDLLPS